MRFNSFSSFSPSNYKLNEKSPSISTFGAFVLIEYFYTIFFFKFFISSGRTFCGCSPRGRDCTVDPRYVMPVKNPRHKNYWFPF